MRGTLWRARTRRAATIAPGEKAVIEELSGLVLMVEPKDVEADAGAGSEPDATTPAEATSSTTPKPA